MSLSSALDKALDQTSHLAWENGQVMLGAFIPYKKLTDPVEIAANDGSELYIDLTGAEVEFMNMPWSPRLYLLLFAQVAARVQGSMVEDAVEAEVLRKTKEGQARPN